VLTVILAGHYHLCMPRNSCSRLATSHTPISAHFAGAAGLETAHLAKEPIKLALSLDRIRETHTAAAAETAVARDSAKDGAPALAPRAQPPWASAAVVASGALDAYGIVEGLRAGASIATRSGRFVFCPRIATSP